MKTSRLLFGLLGAGLAGGASAQVIDGTVDAAYGAAVSVQTVQTQFGDNESEWNAAYGTIAGGNLNLMLTGNLQNNFNKLEIWIDAAGGGQSVFDSSDNDGAQAMDGLVFDNGFTPETHLIARRGSNKFDLDFADLGAQTASFYEDVFGGADFGSGTTATGVNASSIDVAYDGSNTGGIMGGTGAADQSAALAVTTGLELSIALADLGYTSGPIRVMVAQNNDGHNFFSNQFLGGLPAGTANLGGTIPDMTQFDGDQFFTVVPEPATAALLGMGSLAMLRRRK